MKDVSIAVIMSAYNEPTEYLRLSIESILDQTHNNLDFIIIVDNPNNNDLIDLLVEYANKDGRLRYYVNEKNIGLTGSLNRALKHVKSDYVARMDADDISMPNRLEKQLKYLCENHLDLVGCNVQNIDNSGNTISKETRYPENNRGIATKARFNSPLAHPTWLGKKGIFDNLNGYQEIDACEDYDFLVRAILSGFKLGNLQETLLQYRINESGISSTKRSKQKAALYYISERYRKRKITTEEQYNSFINSDVGRTKIKELESYYDDRKQMKSLEGNPFGKLLYGFKIFLRSKEARRLVINIIEEKLLVKN